MPEESGSLSSVGKLIPSVFYDLIARICPGVAFLVGIFWHKRHTFEHPVSNAWVGFFLLLGAGYLAGLVLTALSFVWGPLIGLPIQFGLDIPVSEWSRNDKIANVNPEAGATLAKMQAEATLAQNLLTAFIILWFADGGKGTLCLGLVMRHRMIIVLALGLTALFRTLAYLGRQQNLYEIYLPGSTERFDLRRYLDRLISRFRKADRPNPQKKLPFNKKS
jgi:hypothetical protein